MTSFAERYGPWALVTGAAMGIGASYVEQLAARGLNVVLVDKEAKLMAEVAAKVPDGVETREIVTDLADPEAVMRALDSVSDLVIGLLVANAAHAATAPWLQIPLDDKLRQIRVNCIAVTQMVDVISRGMARRGHGGIIVMSSMAARIGSPRVATYAATKAFDMILAESLWVELSRHGVDVLGVLPGTTKTPGFEGSLGPRAKIPPAVGVMKPADVAREALDALGKRPSIVAGSFNRVAGMLLTRVLPRKAAIRMMARTTRALYPD
ncbi:MAG TPA: SDR family NAD(P)-dependent oxidoreductase [Actinomycetota bacterium]|nr:SDR family NAD(P)-dependent oxidoreductase [Actinomycetota bacterium]